MSLVIGVTAPFFGLFLCGFLAWKFRFLDEPAITGLNGFVLFFALPCLLFRYGASLPLAQVLNPIVLLICATAATATLLCSFALCLANDPRTSKKDAAFVAFAAACPNTGFMGIPLVVILLGPGAAGPAVSSLLVDFFLTSSLCLGVARHQVVPQRAWVSTALHGARRAAGNPFPWAIALGATVHAVDWPIPANLDRVMKMLGDAATPVALFAIGGMFWRARHNARTSPPATDYLPYAAIKLIVHPAFVLGMCALVQHAGAEITPRDASTLILLAALPSAGNVALLAERLGADSGRVSHIVLASTVVALFSFSTLAYVLL